MEKREDAWAIVREDDNRCINTTVWDGKCEWRPPEGCYLVNDYPISIGWYRDPENDIWLKPPQTPYDEEGNPLPGPLHETNEDEMGRTIRWLWTGTGWLLEGVGDSDVPS